MSPYKNAAWLNELGLEAEEKYGVKFLPSDFKKKGGYLRSTELSKQFGLYRQNYCGCRFSKRAAEARDAAKTGRHADGAGRIVLRERKKKKPSRYGKACIIYGGAI